MTEAVAYLPLPSVSESYGFIAVVLGIGMALGWVFATLMHWHGDLVRLCQHHYNHGRRDERARAEYAARNASTWEYAPRVETSNVKESDR